MLFNFLVNSVQFSSNVSKKIDTIMRTSGMGNPLMASQSNGECLILFLILSKPKEIVRDATNRRQHHQLYCKQNVNSIPTHTWLVHSI